MINNLIIAMLQQEGKVLIPSIGTFVHKNGETAFISFLKSNDHKLATYLSLNLGLSNEESEEVVSELANSIKATIDSKGTFELNNVGTLTLDNNGIIAFCPIASAQTAPIQTPPQNPSAADNSTTDNVEDVDSNSTEATPMIEPAEETIEIEQAVEEQAVEEQATIEPETLEEIVVQEEIQEEIIVIEDVEKEAVEEKLEQEEKVTAVESSTSVPIQAPLSDTISPRTLNDTIASSCDNINEVVAQERKLTLCEQLSSENHPQTLADMFASHSEESTTKEPEAPKASTIELAEQPAPKETIAQEQPTPQPEPSHKNDNIEQCQIAEPKAEPQEPQHSIYDDLIKSMKESGSRKAKLYDLYGSSSEQQPASKAANNATTTTAPQSRPQPTMPATPPQPKKEGMDFAVIISIVALALAILVTAYYFFVRG